MNEERAVRPEHQYRTEGQATKMAELHDETPTVVVTQLDDYTDEVFEDE